VSEHDTVRQAEKLSDEPLLFIPDEAQKRAGELEKKVRDALVQNPETGKLALAIKQASENIHTDKENITLKGFTEVEKSKHKSTLDTVIQQLTQARMQERLQNTEQDIVKERTFGE
jgi:hypothetical protein